MDFKELDNNQLHKINGGEDGDFYKDVAYAAGYAYQSTLDYFERLSWAFKRSLRET